MSEVLPIRQAPRAADVDPDPDAFLRSLGGPVAFHLTGRDRRRTRVAVALSHGNEPSGFRAVHRLLRGSARPAVDALLIVTSVGAALREPLYSHRHLPGRRDLNRCFRGPFEGSEGRLAREVLRAIEAARPEAVADLHNNSGHNPPYGVGPRAGPVELAVTRLFGERFVRTRLEIGALVEVVRGAPVLTVECGRAGDPAADAVATRGLERLLGAECLAPAGASASPVELLVDPVRVRLRPGLGLAVGDVPAPAIDFTLRADVDRHNFEELPPGTLLGWLQRGAPWPLEARGEDGDDRARRLFSVRDGALTTRARLTPIMMTTDPVAAREDCLFYAVRRSGETGASGGADAYTADSSSE